MQWLRTSKSPKRKKGRRVRDMVYFNAFERAALGLFHTTYVHYLMKAARQCLNLQALSV